MNNEQYQNRDYWAQLTQDDYVQTHQQQKNVPENDVPEGYAPVRGYAPVQGYAPAEAQDGYSDYQQSTASPFDAHHTQSISTYTVDDDDIPGEEIRDFVSSRVQKRKSKSQAMPKEDQPKSKRAERRKKIAEQQGEVSATDQPKGLVEWREGVFQWWDPVNEGWLNAAYHDVYREQFIREDSTEGTYVVAPDRGPGKNDITSPCSAFNQLEWRLADRESWHNIVDAEGNRILYSINRPAVQSYDEPERLWFHDGYVLLDGDNNPVRPWAGIPRCFSSKIEGGRIEALRRILPMTIQDFRARMLRAVPTGAGVGASTKPLSYPSTFGHRSSRFRTLYQCVAWLPRAASAVLKKQVTDLLPEAEDATTTEGLQVLSRYEIARRKSSTRGKFLYKATGRAISDQERERRNRKIDQRLERQAASQPSTPRRLQSMPTTPWQSASSSPYLPTPPLSAGNKRRWDYDSFGDSQSERAVKRGRLGTSPRDPRLQGRFPTPQTSPEDQFRQASNADNATTIFSTIDSHHGLSGSNATGLGLDFGDGNSVSPQNRAPSNNTHVSEAPSKGTTSTNSSENEDNFQPDHRFVDPQSSIEQQWIEPDRPPVLADVNPWHGSFSTVPIPDLPDRVTETILRPNSNTRMEQDGESSGWSDDLFGEYIEDLEDADGDGEVVLSGDKRDNEEEGRFTGHTNSRNDRNE